MDSKIDIKDVEIVTYFGKTSNWTLLKINIIL